MSSVWQARTTREQSHAHVDNDFFDVGFFEVCNWTTQIGVVMRVVAIKNRNMSLAWAIKSNMKCSVTMLFIVALISIARSRCLSSGRGRTPSFAIIMANGWRGAKNVSVHSVLSLFESKSRMHADQIKQIVQVLVLITPITETAAQILCVSHALSLSAVTKYNASACWPVELVHVVPGVVTHRGALVHSSWSTAEWRSFVALLLASQRNYVLVHKP